MTSLRLYLYGRSDPRIAGLFAEREFHDLLRGLFADRRAAPGKPEVLRSAVDCGLLREEAGEVRAGPRILLVPSRSEQAFQAAVEDDLHGYVEVAADAVAELARAYAGTAAAGRFGWRDVSHSVVAGMFLDLAVGSELWRSGRIARQPWETLVWAFERVSASNAFGVQWVGHCGRRLGFAQLWHHRIERPGVKVSERCVEILGRIAASEPVAADKDLLYLRYLRLVRQQGASWVLTFPAFEEADARRLFPLLAGHARRLVQEAINPALERTADPFWTQGVGRGDASRHAAVRLILEYGIDRVISAGLLAPFPEGAEVPVHLGRWLWREPVGGPELVAGGFGAAGVDA